ANRGIGFELVKQLLDSPDNLVIATCRNPDKATALSDLKNTAKGTLHIIQLDVTDFANVRASTTEVEAIIGDIGLDCLVNNAAIFTYDTAFTSDPDTLLCLLRTNVAGPALVAQVCLPLLERGHAKMLVNVSSTSGSIGSVKHIEKEEHRVGGAAYSISKAALNMLTYKQKVERPDLIVLALCPGWVKTDMGGQQAALEPEESVAGILKVVTSATPADSGKFLSFSGAEVPW
ncbi:NAD-P-binding protein, partial [Trametes versicolor FP-101664 SS1]|uniref:NAD-P-binding protein n=1 Tax=Trametes versicolor (strain FP-101664) TaxID=717944 RepID=UPI0004624317